MNQAKNVAQHHVAVFGDVNVDLLMPVSHYPRPGQEAMSGELISRVGGSAANTSIVLSKLGLTTRLIGRVGSDLWGDLALRELSDAGTDTSCIQRDDVHPTGMTFVPTVPGGEHAMFCYRGANDYADPALVESGAFEGATLLHVSGYALGHAPQRDAAARAIAARQGALLSLDTALEPALRFADEMRWLLPDLALCVLGPEEAHRLTGESSPEQAVRQLLRAGVECVGLKLGADGCLLGNSDGLFQMPALPVATVDTTGAGDAFSAGLILALLRRLPLPACALLASAAGALATTVWGGGAAFSGREPLVRLIADAELEPEAEEYREQVLDVLGN